MLIKSNSRHMHPLKRNIGMTENLICSPNNFVTLQSEICMIWKKKKKKKVPLTKLTIGYSEVIP